MRALGAIVVVAAVMMPAAAMAYTQGDANACTSDAFRFCRSAIPHVNRITVCLIQNLPQLSPACQAVFERYRAMEQREHSVNLRRATY